MIEILEALPLCHAMVMDYCHAEPVVEATNAPPLSEVHGAKEFPKAQLAVPVQILGTRNSSSTEVQKGTSRIMMGDGLKKGCLGM